MRPPRRTRAPLAALLLAATLPAVGRAQPPAPLRVVRTTPAADAGPVARVSVTFDRPVAGALDQTAVDPATLLRVEPAIPGRVEWRDPSTIRLTPAAPLAPGRRYAVTVAAGVRALDGSRLAAPYRFTFRAAGPALLAANALAPAGDASWTHLGPRPRFRLVYAAPVDLAALSAAAYLELRATCGGARVVRLRAAEQRRVRADDPGELRDAGGWGRDRAADSLRRVVVLAPDAPLPRGCAGELVAPQELAPGSTREAARYAFATFGDLRIARVACAEPGARYCPTGPVTVEFTNPVRGADVRRRVRLVPAVTFDVRDAGELSTTWTLEAPLAPRRAYAVVADTALRDAFGQPLRGNPAAGLRTTGHEPEVSYPFGRLLVERVGFRTLAVRHVNVDTLVAAVAPVPPALEAALLASRGDRGDADDDGERDSVWTRLFRGAPVRRVAVRATPDRAAVTGLPLPVLDAARADAPGLYAVRVAGRAARGVPAQAPNAGGAAAPAPDTVRAGPTALVQVTDLGVHARVGTTEGWVWVTGVSDGSARANAAVTLLDARGRPLASARTDARGLAHLTGWSAPRRAPADTADGGDDGPGGFEGYVRVSLGDDRAYAAVDAHDPDLSPWQFNVSRAWGDQRVPVAGALFTERGIYRPGERVVAKAVVRDGALGALRAPAAGDSVEWRFHARDEGTLLEARAPLSAFGTADRAVELPRAAPAGDYEVEARVRRLGRWRTVARARYRVAEYRPPEFLVELDGVRAGRLPGDTLAATVQARYLFGARMGRAAVAWTARQVRLSPWELEIPGLDGWYVGATDAWNDDDDWERLRSPAVFASGADTLDPRGERALAVRLPARPDGRPARVTLQAAVTDVNRQQVAASTTALVHPADFYVAARVEGKDYFWRAGTPVRVRVLAVRPDGARVSGVAVRGAVVRREWHRVRRVRGGVAELVGEWVSDTVARCAITTAAEPGVCEFTPRAGGEYAVRLTAADGRGRRARTSFRRWADGPEFVPWNDESQFRMDVIPDKPRYAVGDTALVLLAAPFTDAEAWVTVEREGVIEQRRLRLAAGATTLRLPVTEAYAPNAFVSVLVARGRTAGPGPGDDPGRPTIRVGYAELRVTPEVKRLQVAVAPERPEYGPGDSARVRLLVRDARGAGRRAEVTLWAVDEGVLALTGYQTPDPLDLVYQARGVGMRLASNMTGLAPQVPDGEKGQRAPGGGGGADGAEVLRSRFQTTAFFLGSVVTSDDGTATAAARLPENLTTFRVMAVAVTDGDRYGRGQAGLLVTRPLVARAALPRFVRPGDAFAAGAVVNRRDGRAAAVRVRAASTAVALGEGAERGATLAAGRGAELRFAFRAPATLPADPGARDSAAFRFDVADGDRHRDAVRVALPVRPDRRPRVRTFAGVVRDSATVEIPVPAGVDLARSRLALAVGGSPLAAVRGIAGSLRVYPYGCSEQVISAAVPILALLRAEREAGAGAGAAPNGTAGGAAGGAAVAARLAELARAADVLARRQRADGGIGYWSATDWSSAWLSAYAGLVLLDARDAGVAVDARVLARLAAYVTGQLRGTSGGAPRVVAGGAVLTPVAYWTDRREGRLRDRVAAADFLSRLGRPDVSAEHDLLRGAAELPTEDRARLAAVVARRGDLAGARRLLAPAWARVRVEGRRAVLPDTAPDGFYFPSQVRPAATLLAATLAVEPDHPLVGPLVEGLVDQGRAARTSRAWNTQDYAAAVSALAAYERRRREAGERRVRVRAGGRVILDTRAPPAARDSGVALASLVASGGGAAGARSVRLTVDAGPGAGSVYYWLDLAEVPAAPAVSPEDAGITVERWYERYDGPPNRAITSAAAGELVRVRLRVRVPATRHFVVLDDALPAGLEAVDLSLRTAAAPPGPGAPRGAPADDSERTEPEEQPRWAYGSWDGGWWSPFDHRELRDDRVLYSAAVLWPGTYTATYLARATTPGTFVRPPAHAEEMYNPGVYGETDAGTFVVTARP